MAVSLACLLGVVTLGRRARRDNREAYRSRREVISVFERDLDLVEDLANLRSLRDMLLHLGTPEGKAEHPDASLADVIAVAQVLKAVSKHG